MHFFPSSSETKGIEVHIRRENRIVYIYILALGYIKSPTLCDNTAQSKLSFPDFFTTLHRSTWLYTINIMQTM